MPKDKDPLPDAQVALLRSWIAQGAAWPDDGPMTAAAAPPEEDLPQHWAYRRPIRPTPPAVAHKAWVRNPIDQFVAARFEKEGLEPSPEASKEDTDPARVAGSGRAAADASGDRRLRRRHRS
jgi:hypothetical protein